MRRLAALRSVDARRGLRPDALGVASHGTDGETTTYPARNSPPLDPDGCAPICRDACDFAAGVLAAGETQEEANSSSRSGISTFSASSSCPGPQGTFELLTPLLIQLVFSLWAR
jgi:hypothetical protein